MPRRAAAAHSVEDPGCDPARLPVTRVRRAPDSCGERAGTTSDKADSDPLLSHARDPPIRDVLLFKRDRCGTHVSPIRRPTTGRVVAQGFDLSRKLSAPADAVVLPIGSALGYPTPQIVPVGKSVAHWFAIQVLVSRASSRASRTALPSIWLARK